MTTLLLPYYQRFVIKKQELQKTKEERNES
jgi:hypothetical protein